MTPPHKLSRRLQKQLRRRVKGYRFRLVGYWQLQCKAPAVSGVVSLENIVESEQDP